MNKTAQFTPGPWFTTSEMRGIGGVKVYGVETRDRYPIANCGTGKLGMDNATLIAAAPAMYEALKGAIATIAHMRHYYAGNKLNVDDIQQIVEAGYTALSQAEGR